jgi:hypothetical protein
MGAEFTCLWYVKQSELLLSQMHGAPIVYQRVSIAIKPLSGNLTSYVGIIMTNTWNHFPSSEHMSDERG